MVSLGVLVGVGGALILYLSHAVVSGLLGNIARAKQARLPYLVVFCSPYNKLWQVTHVLWVAVIKRVLPKAWWEDWLFVMEADWSYRLQQEPWDRLGESFLVVSPGNILMFTSNAEAIRQVTARRDDFPKPADQYRILALFGENVITTEGALWRMHRKVTSASFNERNAAFAFAESIHQTRGMVRHWRRAQGWDDGHGTGTRTPTTTSNCGDARTITTLPLDIMTLTLQIIGSVGFGLRFQWPGQTGGSSDVGSVGDLSAAHGLAQGDGHTMTFPQSLAMLLDRILALLMLPTWILRTLPFQWAREAHEAKENYARYMEEFLRRKKEELRLGGGGRPGSGDDGTEQQGMDIMGGLVRSKYGADDAFAKPDLVFHWQGEQLKRRHTYPPPARAGAATAAVEGMNGEDERASAVASSAPTNTPCPQLSDSDIIGNAFIMIVAGHETTSNALHFTLVELANNPAAQRALQADVDRIYAAAGIKPDDDDDDAAAAALAEGLDSSTVSFERFVGDMLASMPGAVLNETLRLMPAVVEIPKKVTPHRDQVLTIDGEDHLIPRGTTIALTAAAAHRSPRYWPPPPPGGDGVAAASDVNDWVPARWFRKSLERGGSGSCSSSASASDDSSASESSAGESTSADDGSTAATSVSSSSSVASPSSYPLFRPVRGSFVPFSDGARSCLGRRIAQVKLMGALAVIFRSYTVELAVDALASDEDVARMGPTERAVIYDKAREASRAVLRTAGSVITLKLPGDSHVPVRVVRRGRERFVGVVDGHLTSVGDSAGGRGEAVLGRARKECLA